MHKQLRALTVLDCLIENAGPRFQRTFADEPLLERLRVAATDSLSDAQVKKKCSVLFRQWAATYQSTPGMERIVALHKQLPQRKKPPRQENSRVVRETEEEVQADPFGNNDYRDASPPSSARRDSYSSPLTAATFSQGPSLAPLGKPEKSKRRKSKSKPFNLEKEKPQLLQAIASSSVASTNLMNALKLINREHKRVGEDPEALKRFENCKLLRRQILRYIQFVESEQWLGSLIHANEELVNALMAFEVLDKSVDDDSDSEGELENHSQAQTDVRHMKRAQQALAGLTIDQPSGQKPNANGKARAAYDGNDDGEEEDSDVEEEDEDDPFADRNAVSTPKTERPGMAWYVCYDLCCSELTRAQENGVRLSLYGCQSAALWVRCPMSVVCIRWRLTLSRTNILNSLYPDNDAVLAYSIIRRSYNLVSA